MASSKKQRCLQSSSTGDELDSSLGYKTIGKFHKIKATNTCRGYWLCSSPDKNKLESKL